MEERPGHRDATPRERAPLAERYPDLLAARRRVDLPWLVLGLALFGLLAGACELLLPAGERAASTAELLGLRLTMSGLLLAVAWAARHRAYPSVRTLAWTAFLLAGAGNGLAWGRAGIHEGLGVPAAAGAATVGLCGFFPARRLGALALCVGTVTALAGAAALGAPEEALPARILPPLAFLLLAVSPIATIAAARIEAALRSTFVTRRVLDDALVQAQASTRARSAFLATMSHEIRTPLNGVLGMTALLQDTKLTREQGECVQTALSCGDALLSLVNDILDLSKMEAGHLELETSDFSLDEVIESVPEMLSALAHPKNLALSSRIDPDVPMAVRGDPNRLRQVLMNLVGNALKFTHEGSIHVHASLVRESLTEAVVNVDVVDTGIGVPPDEQARLFLPFTQARSASGTQAGGTGLGLAIVRKIVRLMGGEVGVQSTGAGGSTFWFSMRLEKQSRLRRQAQRDGHRLVGARVLIVDDVATNRVILEKQLRQWEMRPEACADSTDVLRVVCQAQAAKDPYRVLLLDMRMPQMDGLDVVRRLRREPHLRVPPVVLLSSVGITERVRAARQEGVLTCLSKPVRPAYLRAWLLKGVLADPALPLEEREAAAPAPALRVLVAEDNPVNVRLAIHLLKKFGYEPHAVSDGLEAVAAARTHDFAAVLMDVGMPRMDGLRATRAIRGFEGRRGRVPIIAMTAHALQGDRERSLDAGMDDYLSKPVQQDVLRQTLARWTRRPSDDLRRSAPDHRRAS